MITEQTMKQLKDIVTGITIDRGCGDEFFPIIDTKEEDTKIYYYIGNNDWVDKDFLNSCSYVDFHVKREYDVEIKNDVTLTNTEIQDVFKKLYYVRSVLQRRENITSMLKPKNDIELLSEEIQYVINIIENKLDKQ